MKIGTIAVNTLKEAVRNKIFYLLIVVGMVFAVSSRLVSIITIGDKAKVLKDVGLASIHFFGVLVAIFTGINLIFKEIDKKTIYNILSKPISRTSFILGKFLGLAYTLFIALAAMVLIFFFFLFISTGEWDWTLLIYFGMLYLELLIITSVSLLFSSFSTPILSSILTIVIYMIGKVLWTFNEFKHKLEEPITKVITYFFYYILPNLEKYDIKDMIVMNEEIKLELILPSIVYGILYISALLILTIFIFRKREFQ